MALRDEGACRRRQLAKQIHSVEATAANVHDARVQPSLLHGEERRGYSDQAYRDQTDLPATHTPKAKDWAQPSVQWTP